MGRRNETNTFEVALEHATDKAILVIYADDIFEEEVWIPRSLLVDDHIDADDIGTLIDIEIPVWKAEELEWC